MIIYIYISLKSDPIIVFVLWFLILFWLIEKINISLDLWFGIYVIKSSGKRVFIFGRIYILSIKLTILLLILKTDFLMMRLI